jgi:hypothetical protein
MIRGKKVAIFGTGVFFLAVLAASQKADAVSTHAAQCGVVGPIVGPGGTSGLPPSGSGGTVGFGVANDLYLTGTAGTGGGVDATLVNVSPSKAVRVICPVPRKLDGSPPSLANVGLDVWKNTPTSIAAKGCHTFVGGFGGVCTPSNIHAAIDIEHITFPQSAWNNAHYNYVYATLQPCNALGCNRIVGYIHNL